MIQIKRLVWLVPAGILSCGLALLANATVHQARLNRIRADRVVAKESGVLLEGPKYAFGDVDELVITKVELGPAILPHMSEAGDLLFGSLEKITDEGSKAKRQIVFKVRRVSGKIEAFPGASRVYMTPSGRVYAVMPTSKGYRVDMDGKTIIPDSDRAAFPYLDVSVPCDDGLLTTTTEESFGRITGDHRQTMWPIPDGTIFGGWQSSSILGSYAVVTSKNLLRRVFPRNEMVHFVGNRLEYIQLPDECPNPYIMACRNALYLTPDDTLAPKKIFEYRGTTFQPLPVVPDSTSLDLVGANSAHEFILTANFGLKSGQVVRQPEHYFVRDGKCYDLDKILRRAGIRVNLSTIGIVGPSSRFLSEESSFVVNQGIQMYLVRIMPHQAVVSRSRPGRIATPVVSSFGADL